MGGKALNTNTERIDLKTYNKIKTEIYCKLRDELNYNDVRFIPFYKSKDSFGDLDILVSEPKPNNLISFLYDNLNTKDLKINHDIVSFEYKDFQIDLIHCPAEYLDIAQTYFSYNDLGMLMGTVAKKINCKYGHTGLYYIKYNSDKSKKWEIFLSKEPRKIFNFLDLDYDVFLRGFNTLEEIYDYIYSSTLFDSNNFLYEKEWNHRKKTRNRKRPTWQKFIEYIKHKPIKEGLNVNPLEYCCFCFGKDYLLEEINTIEHNENMSKLIRSKFNGNIVRELTGYDKIELSKFISEFKKQFINFDTFIVNNNQSTINSYILQFKTQKEKK